ncbi:MAG: CDF family Co(II)/Ni(II) efflux transporter DmeF [Alphaproteobacteria bacterium]
MHEGVHLRDAHEHGRHGEHVFLGEGHARAQSRTLIVTWLTAAFMVVEVVAGLVFGSMALLADGVHMATHAGALGLAAGAYWLARRHARDTRFTFGSGKFGDLAAFASALVLGLIGIGVGVESVMRLYAPVEIQYLEAIIVAALGLLLNIVCALLLREPGTHGHAHPHRDHNLRAAYLHVLADAATSVLAVVALMAGLWLGAGFLDPAVGLVGAVMIVRWSWQLMRDSALVLLDAEDDPRLARDIRDTLNEMGVSVSDLHLWRVGPGHRALIVSIVSANARAPDEFKTALAQRYRGLSHVTVEVTVCGDCAP